MKDGLELRLLQKHNVLNFGVMLWVVGKYVGMHTSKERVSLRDLCLV